MNCGTFCVMPAFAGVMKKKRAYALSFFVAAIVRLLDYLRDYSGADSAAALAYSETEALAHGDRGD